MPARAIFSFGGGIQSWAAAALAARGELHHDTFLFANTGEDSENPDTLAYLREHEGFFARHGLTLVVLDRVMLAGPRRGQVETLYQQVTREGSRSIQIPVRMANGAPGRRNCTEAFKLDVIRRWIDAHTGASAERPIEVGVGISLDEIGRMRTDQPVPNQRRTYPLIERRITREDCKAIIASAGLPVPPKSACWFCPLHRIAEWQEIADATPGLFARACDLEERINARRASLGRDNVYLHRRLLPLAQAVRAGGAASDDDGCDSGHCMT